MDGLSASVAVTMATAAAAQQQQLTITYAMIASIGYYQWLQHTTFLEYQLLLKCWLQLDQRKAPDVRKIGNTSIEQIGVLST